MAKWIETGWFIDFRDVPVDLRPPKVNTDFAYVKAAEMTRFDSITTEVKANSTAVIDFSNSNINKLRPLSNMIFQVAWGFYPDLKAYAIHPVDNSVGKLPQELPSKQYRVGIITMEDSPYDEPNLSKTELFLTPAEGCYTPKFVFYENYGRDCEVWLALTINMLKLEPVTDEDVVKILRKHIKPSYPVRLFMFKG